jgi:DNA polymerase V
MQLINRPIHAGFQSSFESPAAEYAELALKLDPILVTKPAATYVVKVEGHSMEGVGIFDGDLLIVDRSLTAITGDIVAASLNGEFVCKEIDLQRRMLKSHHSDFPIYRIRENDEFEVLGVVTRSIRMFKPLTDSIESYCQ